MSIIIIISWKHGQAPCIICGNHFSIVSIYLVYIIIYKNYRNQEVMLSIISLQSIRLEICAFVFILTSDSVIFVFILISDSVIFVFILISDSVIFHILIFHRQTMYPLPLVEHSHFYISLHS